MLCPGVAPPSRVTGVPSLGLVLSPQPPTVDTLTNNVTMSITGHPQREQEYGYLSYFHHVVLSLDEVDRLVHTVTEELGTRGLTTAFLFSSHALDVNSSRVRRLIQAFLCTCVSFPASDAECTWQEEARFAALPEVAMCLRSGLARVLRVSGGMLCEASSLGICTSSGAGPDLVSDFSATSLQTQCRFPFIVQDYPPTHFEALIAHLLQPPPSIIINVISLARLTPHSSSSGHTHPTLSRLFEPLLFGLGPAALSFHHTYLEYLLATNSMEHVLLSFVRWQDVPSNESSGSFGGGPGNAASLGVPTRLKDSIRGYPAVLPEPAT